MTSRNDDAPTWQGRGGDNIIAFNSHRKPTTPITARKHWIRASRPTQSSKVATPLRTVLELVLDARIAHAEGTDRVVRLFLGATAIEAAVLWSARHGAGTALALPDGVEPDSIPWPAVRKIVVVLTNVQVPLALCEALAAALRGDGVGYASIPHLPEWPNLWPACDPRYPA